MCGTRTELLKAGRYEELKTRWNTRDEEAIRRDERGKVLLELGAQVVNDLCKISVEQMEES